MSEFVEEAGFPDASLPDDRHDLAVSDLGLLQGLVQGGELCMPPHKGGQPPRRKRLPGRASRASAHQLAHLHGCG